MSLNALKFLFKSTFKYFKNHELYYDNFSYIICAKVLTSPSTDYLPLRHSNTLIFVERKDGGLRLIVLPSQ